MDLISRQAAIDALHYWFADGFKEDRWWNSTHVLAALEGVPSIQPDHIADGGKMVDAEPVRRGKWVDSNTNNMPYKCDQCGRSVFTASDFCPNCGARMDVGRTDKILPDVRRGVE